MPTQLKQISLYDNNSVSNSMSTLSQASQVAAVVKNLPVNAGTHKRRRFNPWGREETLDAGMVTHSSILAWRIP